MKGIGKYFGPSTLITAAFIGPGTLTVCTIAGSSFGYSLLWVMVFAIIATIVLQEMAARLGLVTQNGLGEAMREYISNPAGKVVSIVLVFIAIVLGNAAYEAGNILGASLGMEGLLGSTKAWPLIIGSFAFILLLIGKFKIIENLLIGLVLLMSLVFITTAIIIGPNLGEMFQGLFIPSISDSNQLTILALVGTTIVPYNLFLHASSVSKKWKNEEDLSDLRKENFVAIILGGIISLSIIITSAGANVGSLNSVHEMAIQLEPTLGSWSIYFLGLGLFAAGISSAITAPMAAAYAAKGIFGWKDNSHYFKIIWISVLIAGVLFSMLGFRPISVIQLAQVANGILLPVIAIFLVYLCNKNEILGQFINKRWQNILSGFVIMICLLISVRSFNSVFSFL